MSTALGVTNILLARQEVIIEKNEEEMKAKLHSVEVGHQERLESLTNKCLAFEEELSEWTGHNVKHCDHQYVLNAAHHKTASQETEAVLRSRVHAMEKSQEEQ